MLIRNSESQHAFILWNDAFRLYLAKSGEYPKIQGNIATTKLIQCELVDFKVDETNEKSDFYFAPEIAEPLALMLKHIMSHPLYRKNADSSNITATSMAEYNEKLLKDIDETMPTYFNHAVYSLSGQLVAQEISAWLVAFVRELTHFMYNLSRMKRQDIGATLKK